ncbi:MAG TPA: tetratricopeptide repeat protein [Thermoanaerobaculia bacterium]|jgi:tetratricopeptide (TPR) repeat protein|nr:tetratricopeptide repeat protein [Thermoanaerobaculia bacterium]
MSELNPRIEELRQEALAKVRAEEFDDALALYDEALALATDEEVRELLTINKGHALIAAERTGPEVKALPMILMRRRNPHHTFLASYALMYTHRLTSESKRAIFYGNIALEAAKEAEQTFWELAALNELGMVYEIDSQFAKAIATFEQALACLDQVSNESDQTFSRVYVIGNLGYNKLLIGDTREGLRLLHSVIDDIATDHLRSDAYVDLCYGYLDLNEYETARRYGQMSLALASEPRQIRNAHYLLGEAAYKMGDVDAAEQHFEHLARFYPQFRHLKSLLFAIDLRSMLNLKL